MNSKKIKYTQILHLLREDRYIFFKKKISTISREKEIPYETNQMHTKIAIIKIF